MGQNDRDRATPLSLDPETEVIDASWDDDDLASGIDLSSPVPSDRDQRRSERVTAVPDIPAEELARKLMGDVQSEPPSPQEPPAFPERDTPDTFHGNEVPLLELDPEPVSPYAPTHPHLRSAEPEVSYALIDEPKLELGPPPRKSSEPELEVLDADIDGPDSLEGPVIEIESDDRLAQIPDEPETELDPDLRDMKDRYATGDFTGALVIAESLLEANPEHPHALRYAESCRDVLTQMYAARVGSLAQVPIVAVAPDQIRWLSLDHRAGFVLSMIDGSSSIEEILDVSGMTRLDALRILYTLIEQRIIRLESR